MPIDKNGTIKYSIPSNIRSMITPEFCAQFLKELHIIFGASVEDTDMDYFVYQGGTGGWVVAFATACRKLGLDELYKYYTELEWFDSDIFDGEIEDILVEYKLVIGGFIDDEIARQNGLSADDIVCCEQCGEAFLKTDVVLDGEIIPSFDSNEEDFEWERWLCKNCHGDGEVKPLAWDKERTVIEILGKSPAEFFVCEKCGKIHYNAHRGKKYCLHCEYTEKSANKNANDYYLEMYEESKKYRDGLG